MSLDPVGGPRAVSPASIDSGHSPPAPRPRRTVEDGLHKADKSLRKYGAILERTLSTWDVSPEGWADYIAFLGRLLKAIQAHPKDTLSLPYSAVIASKLAQCLNPTLPSGVHQKALEVYAYIFSTFGNDFLSIHLHEYLPGLASVLSFASLSVRPGLYLLFEEHIVKLPCANLRPVLKSLLLSLLPGIEEETGEDFIRAFNVLERLQLKFSTTDAEDSDSTYAAGYFWQCLFLCAITSPTRRHGCQNYLARKMPRLPPESNGAILFPQAEALMSPEPGLLIRCFATGLCDTSLLIQRGFLDLLVTHLPLNSAVLQARVANGDLDRLVSAAVRVLLRRDMSLNRRMWSWFLGPDPKDNDESEDIQLRPPADTRSHSKRPSNHGYAQFQYFVTYGKAPLERCVLNMFNRSVDSAREKAAPFRISLSLMDRWEIGESLIPQIFLPALQSAYTFSLSASADKVTEVLRSASLFFDGVEASLIWSTCMGLLRKALKTPNDASVDTLRLVGWMINNFNVTVEDMVTVHVPCTVLYLLNLLNDLNQPALDEEAYNLAVSTATSLIDSTPARVFQISKNSTVLKQLSDTKPEQETSYIESAINTLYNQPEHALDGASIPLDGQLIPELLLQQTTRLAITSFGTQSHKAFPKSVLPLLAILPKTPRVKLARIQDLYQSINAAVNSAVDESIVLPFPVISSIISTLVALTSASLLSGPDLIALEPCVTKQVWMHLSPLRPKYHVEAVRSLCVLAELVPLEEGIQTSLLDLVRMQGTSPTIEGLGSASNTQHFLILWNHSTSAPVVSSSVAAPGLNRGGSTITSAMDAKYAVRLLEALSEPLLLVLDALHDTSHPEFERVSSWLSNLPSLDRVFRILFVRLRTLLSREAQSIPDSQNQQRDALGCFRDLDYMFALFENILNCGNDWTFQCLRFASIDGRTDGLMTLIKSSTDLLFNDKDSPPTLNRRLTSLLDVLISKADPGALQPLGLDSTLINQLIKHISGPDGSLQAPLLRLISKAIRLRLVPVVSESARVDRPRDSMSTNRPSITSSTTPITVVGLPSQLFHCIRLAFCAPSARRHMEAWLGFLADILPDFADAIFSDLIPLVECLCTEIEKEFCALLRLAGSHDGQSMNAPDASISSLLEAMEMVLVRAHECLVSEGAPEPGSKQANQQTTFLGSMASGMFKAEGPPSRTAKANSRLTVILAFQDAIRTSVRIWSWASRGTDAADVDLTSAATTAHTALRLRNKARRILEQMFGVEPLESLEVVVSLWCDTNQPRGHDTELNLLQAMQDSRPKNIIPTILDALCSRTNPSALPAMRQSSQTVDLSASDVAGFLCAYLASIEDDAMDEIWTDCTSFMRDVLSNPLPYRLVLPALLSIVRLLAEKIDNTNFGEQKKMRRELGDIFQRLLAAIFTTLQSDFVTESTANGQNACGQNGHVLDHRFRELNPLRVLTQVVRSLDLILESPERLTATVNAISSSVVGPMLRAKVFPRNLSSDSLTLLLTLFRKAPAAKSLRREVTDAFNDARLLGSSIESMEDGWLQILHQWCLHDKERMPDLLSKLTPPSSAGIMFGVGANAARLDADRKTQLTVRRVCILLLASPEDTYALHIRLIEEKLVELFEATQSSSPSSAIKAELFMLLRVLLLSMSAVQIAPLWPIINDNLQAALTSLIPDSVRDSAFNNLAILQACKLLDQLVALSPDDFQLHEWLYITDTIDAVYQPSDWNAAALADQVAEALSSDSIENSQVLVLPGASESIPTGQRRLKFSTSLPLDNEDLKALPRNDLARLLVRPFLRQLSMHAYEDMYAMEEPDFFACRRNVLEDVLDLATVVE